MRIADIDALSLIRLGLIMQCFRLTAQGVENRKGPLPENGLSDPSV